MSILALQTFEDPFYSMTVPLDGVDYLLEFSWNQREDAWYFDISLTDGTMLVRGTKIVCQADLLGRFADSRLPPGMLMAWPNTASKKAPGLRELGEGKRVTLLYFEASTWQFSSAE